MTDLHLIFVMFFCPERGRGREMRQSETKTERQSLRYGLLFASPFSVFISPCT